jgi:hypothetical protein
MVFAKNYSLAFLGPRFLPFEYRRPGHFLGFSFYAVDIDFRWERAVG